MPRPVRSIPPGWLTFSEHGDRVGQSHPKAVLTDGQADELVALYLAGGWSYLTLAQHFRVSKASVRDIIKGRRRATPIAHVRRPGSAGPALGAV